MVRFSVHSHLKISWNEHETNHKNGILLSSPSAFVDRRFTPPILFMIVILALLIFLSGLPHLLFRFLVKIPLASQSNRNAQGYSISDALHGQLLQLFSVQDGLDQDSIDALPVFSYKEILGRIEPFDCANCLSQFSETDELRLLPSCNHAFHINCIGTWFLSHSTCPLCRGEPLIPGYTYANPVYNNDEEGCFSDEQSSVEIEENTIGKGVFPVRLGIFPRLNDVGMVGDESRSSALDERRCYSMDSYSFVVGDAKLSVPLSQEKMGRALNRVDIGGKFETSLYYA